MARLKIQPRFLKIFLALFLIFLTMKACEMDDSPIPPFPRDEDLPLFDPHMPSFDCKVETHYVPPIDAEAQKWFMQARALEDPEIYVDDRDYPRIVQLTRQAAERRHWKAMLNLASLYVEGRDATKGTEDAVQLVEAAMRLGIPAAYDRMGTYYMNGTGVPADATTAFAFWQRAARMGNPQAMAHLADKLRAAKDGAVPGYWANIPVAVKMLECSLSQGYGPAAANLHYLYLYPRSPTGQQIGSATPETRARTMAVLHEGVRHGCAICAAELYIEFDHPFKLSEMIAPFVDPARGERYRVLGEYLEFNPDLRFPNLDQVLPLPPANLPTWNGDTDTLLEAAMGVRLPPRPAITDPSALKTSHKALDPAFHLRRSNEQTHEKTAPFAGYWRPKAADAPDAIRQAVAAISPALYAPGERFIVPCVHEPVSKPVSSWLMWEHWLTIDADDGAVRPQAARGLARDVKNPAPLRSCGSGVPCPASGIWQPWIDPGHPMQGIVNVYWRQAWVLQGQPFPRPLKDWRLDLPEERVTWHLLDAGVDIDVHLDA